VRHPANDLLGHGDEIDPLEIGGAERGDPGAEAVSIPRGSIDEIAAPEERAQQRERAALGPGRFGTDL
jgi:hypothetical protein